MKKFVRALPPDIPKVLSHYTKVGNIMNMLRGDTKSVCFLLKNNYDKNDNAELKLGIELMRKFREYLQSNNLHSVLDHVTDFKNSYSLSFTAGEANQYMLSEYGKVCLEFDFRTYRNPKPIKCEYYTDEDVNDLIDQYILDLNQTRNSLTLYEIEWDIIEKLATIKRQKEWEAEKEWRMVLHKQDEDSRCLVDTDGKSRLILNIPISFLTRITLFYDNENKTEMNHMRANLKEWKRKNNIRLFDVVMKNASRFV